MKCIDDCRKRQNARISKEADQGGVMPTKVYVIFAGKPKGLAGWPYAEFDCEQRKTHVLHQLKELTPDIEYVGGDVLYTSSDVAQCVIGIHNATIDGVLLYPLVSFWADPSLTVRATS
jgi:hypothetical protein